jgi:hypothetical protein
VNGSSRSAIKARAIDCDRPRGFDVYLELTTMIRQLSLRMQETVPPVMAIAADRAAVSFPATMVSVQYCPFFSLTETAYV